MPNRQDVVDDVSRYVRDHFEVEDGDEDFGPGVHLYDYGYVDSFGVEELLTHVEQRFGVTIDENTMMRNPLNTINEIADFVVANSPQ